jgi:hypothetical protein
VDGILHNCGSLVVAERGGVRSNRGGSGRIFLAMSTFSCEVDFVLGAEAGGVSAPPASFFSTSTEEV